MYLCTDKISLKLPILKLNNSVKWNCGCQAACFIKENIFILRRNKMLSPAPHIPIYGKDFMSLRFPPSFSKICKMASSGIQTQDLTMCLYLNLKHCKLERSATTARLVYLLTKRLFSLQMCSY